MRTREEVRQEVAKRMTGLDNRVYDEHRHDAGKTYISVSEHRRMCESVSRMRAELYAIRCLCQDEYFVVAPDRRHAVEAELREMEGALDTYHNEVSRVFRDNPYEAQYVVYRSVPVYRPVTDQLCLLAREVLGIHPIHKQYVGQRLVPVVIRRIGT